MGTVQALDPKTVLRVRREYPSPHPTAKPVALFEYLIRTYTNPGEVVLDNAMGSGTTAIACLNAGRHYLGFEKELKYFEAAQKRIAAHQAQLSLLEQTA
jgi:site-specific DNA-methyltransferase (adenine-specific)